MDMLEDVVTYLIVAPLIASVGLGIAAALWLRRPNPQSAPVRVRHRR